MSLLNLFKLILFTTFFCSVISNALASDKLCAMWPDAIKEAEGIRGLSLEREVQCLEFSKTDFAKELAREPKDKIELINEEVIFKALGLIPKEFDYTECATRERQDFLLAYYDTESKKVLINKDSNFSFDILVHEAVHALQDQEFDIHQIGEKSSRTTDSALAFSALVEGDAMLVQQIYLSSKTARKSLIKQQPKRGATCKYPPMYENLSLFPYTFGKLFSTREFENGGFKVLNQRFAHPVLSTRAIIHKGDAKFVPTPVSLKPQEIENMLSVKLKEKLYSDTFGQYFIRALLGSSISDSKAVKAASGWVGDEIALFNTDSYLEYVLAWKIMWENKKQTKEFLSAFTEHLRSIAEQELSKEADKVRLTMPDGKKYLLERHGKIVTMAAIIPK